MTEIVGGAAGRIWRRKIEGVTSVPEAYALILEISLNQEALAAASRIAAEEAEIVGGAVEGYGGVGVAGGNLCTRGLCPDNGKVLHRSRPCPRMSPRRLNKRIMSVAFFFSNF